MPQYRRVTYEDRCQIRAYLDSKVSKSEIARTMGFHKSTIGREIKRNTRKGRSYWAKKANDLALERFSRCRRKILIRGDLEVAVREGLQEKWSPDQISGRLKLEGKYIVSREAIYRFIRADKRNQGELWKNLRRPPKRGKGRYLSRKYKPAWLLRISERPQIINDRQRIGDWERDTMLTMDRQRLLVCVERKTRFLALAKLDGHGTSATAKMTKQLLKDKPLLSITNDNGNEFRDFYQWNFPLYYCDPYRPHQRGTVENTIGLLRQYIPKKTKVDDLQEAQVKKIEDRLNMRPRKCLDYRTPYEVFYKRKVALVS